MSERLDQHLVRAGLARSRNQAQRLIRAGAVTVEGRPVQRPSYAVDPGQQVRVTRTPDDRWVGRGALKLLHALQLWGGETPPLRVTGRRCLDVGASTGGFTQVLLEHGAREVTALDVGHGQLVPELAADPRVTDLPGTNIRTARAQELGTFDLVVGDVSFISLTLVVPVLPDLLGPGGESVLLVKPQFEVGRDRLGRGGVVTDPQARADALRSVCATATREGLHPRGIASSPVTGSHGNTEYLLWLTSYPTGMMSAAETSARIDQLTREDD